MAITRQDLIDGIRQMAGIQNNGFFQDNNEMYRIVQNAVSNCYNTVVLAYAPYFSEQADFTLDDSGVINLNDIINPRQDIVANIHSWMVTGNGTEPIFLPNISSPGYTQITQLTIEVVGGTSSNTGSTTFTIYSNGVSTGLSVTVPNGSPVAFTVSNANIQPTYTIDDVLTIVVTAGTSGSWAAAATIYTQPILNNPTFFKELGVDYLGNGIKLTVPRLSSFMHRNDGYITTLPVSGPYRLFYVPSCPVLSDVTDLPAEMERFEDMILLEGAIRVCQKRGQESLAQSFRNELNIKKKETQDALRNRVNEPKVIPVRNTIATMGRSYDIQGQQLKVYQTTGNGGLNNYGWRFGY